MAATQSPAGALARISVLVIFTLLGIRFIQIARGTPAPVRAADVSPGHELLRLEWLGRCRAPRAALGLYARTDFPCQPRRAESLDWLRGELDRLGMLADDEHLFLIAHPAKPTCGVVIVAGAQAKVTGWVCSDISGLYRADAAGNDAGVRWQLWSDGGWVQVS